mmetsp:Transcript_5464/g.10411  ORF Transcript_5464/g.10411 Transcript_5464/m.10411 type:complete len:404 (+) Transcript_5464:62-1273(+)
MDSARGSFNGNSSAHLDDKQYCAYHQGNVRPPLPAMAILDRLSNLRAPNSNALPGWTDWLSKGCVEELRSRGGQEPRNPLTADVSSMPAAMMPQTMGVPMPPCEAPVPTQMVQDWGFQNRSVQGLSAVPAGYGPMPTLLAAMHSPGNPQECEAPGSGFQQCSISGKVWALSRDPATCRVVQGAFDEAARRGDRQALLSLAGEMKGHVWEAARCPHANYVLQKLITVVAQQCGPESVQFVIDELLCRRPHIALQASRHKFGCRIPQRLLEVCHPQQVERLVEAILLDAKNLCTHPLGNYVIQSILDFGTEHQVHRVLQMLHLNAAEMMANDAASAVLTKGLKSQKAAAPDKAALAGAMLADAELFNCMARTRHGHQVAKLTMEVVEQPDSYRMNCLQRKPWKVQ